MSKKNIHFHLKFPAVATIFHFQSVHKFHRETLGYKIYITNFWGDISNVDPSKRVTAIAVF